MSKICIVSHFAYSAFTNSASGHIGGVEIQTSRMAKWLAKQGHEVKLIIWGIEGESGQHKKIDGVDIIQMCHADDGLPVLRFFYPRWTSLVHALREANADIYYHNCAEYVTGQIAHWCKRNYKKFIYSVASDLDCVMGLPQFNTLSEKYLYIYGLKSSDLVIAQTDKQKIMLMNNYGLDAKIIPMPCPGPDDLQYSKIQAANRKTILWVGRISEEKRLEWFLDIAEALPDFDFVVLGKPNDMDSVYYLDLCDNASRLSNVNMVGAVKYTEMSEYYASSSLLCCTSVFEGFPNTFLEAWSYGVPVLSTVDPDNVITQNGLGYEASTKEEFVEYINLLMKDESLWEKCSEQSRQYYLEHHQVDGVMSLFEKTFVDIENEKN